MECPICCNAFDLDAAVPKVLKCGHSYCLECVNSLASSSDRRPSFFGSRGSVICPHCRKSCFPEEINTNFALMELLQSRADPPPSAPPLSEMRRCVTHNEEIDTFCDTCCRFLCRLCYQSSTSDHSSHIRLSLEDATGLVEGLTLGRLQDAQQQKEYSRERLRQLDASLGVLREKLTVLNQQGNAFFSRCQEQLQLQHESFNINVLQHYEKISIAYEQTSKYLHLQAQQWEDLESKLQDAADKGASLDAIEKLVDCGDSMPERIDNPSLCADMSSCELNIGTLEFRPLVGCLPKLFELRREDRRCYNGISDWRRSSLATTDHECIPGNDDTLPPDLRAQMSSFSLD
eukprot:GEMP01052789.1.p1 GENE.GEMP01052789.1~~GEMP01052789.1.p1  ORF type:complete len:387 (+),score=63.75 GEMP01052789.1:124-1161(+)